MAAAGDGETLDDVLEDLPPELRAEVEDFARFLREHRNPPRQGEIGFSWAGALRELRDEYTSTELAERSVDWWET